MLQVGSAELSKTHRKHGENHGTSVQMAKPQLPKCWREYGDKGIFVHSWREWNWCSHYEKLYADASKNLSRASIWYNNPTTRCLPKENEVGLSKSTWTLIIVTALYAIDKIRKQPMPLLIYKLIKKIGIHTYAFAHNTYSHRLLFNL